MIPTTQENRNPCFSAIDGETFSGECLSISNIRDRWGQFFNLYWTWLQALQEIDGRMESWMGLWRWFQHGAVSCFPSNWRFPAPFPVKDTNTGYGYVQPVYSLGSKQGKTTASMWTLKLIEGNHVPVKADIGGSHKQDLAEKQCCGIGDSLSLTREDGEKNRALKLKLLDVWSGEAGTGVYQRKFLW